MGKNGRKIYNFDDHVEFGEDVVEARMDDEQPIVASHDVHKGDAVMKDVPHGDAHSNMFGTGFGDTSSFMTMLQNMQLRKDDRYMEDCRR